ncbi:MAG: hypothetical protein NT013_25080 [Planctomycetia bacterium]|nr:hypothetical protein [Planctomycetia bacterium]
MSIEPLFDQRHTHYRGCGDVFQTNWQKFGVARILVISATFFPNAG